MSQSSWTVRSLCVDANSSMEFGPVHRDSGFGTVLKECVCIPHVIVIIITNLWSCASCFLQRFRMSSQSGADRKPQDQVEKEEEEDFYDCQEMSDLREEEKAEKKTQQEAGGSQDFHIKTETITNRTDNTDCGTEALHQKEEQGDRLQDDSDSDLKEDKSGGVEFDDDYLREVEEDLTEEEKEVTLLPEPCSYSWSH